MAMSEDRVAVLHALIAYRLPVEATVEKLASFGWDAVEPVAFVRSGDIDRILTRYLAHELTGDQVTDWADLVECREDIGYQPGQEHLADIIFDLANPNLRGPITPELAKRIQGKLFGISKGV
jgi:hypothetical protein